MRTLKDIKVSSSRLPLQNALWIRPTGGLTFKLYIPNGDTWKEIAVTEGGDTPSPTPTPSKAKKGNCDGGKVIVGKCIPKYPMVGDRYYFADGIIKFKKSKRSYGQWTIMRYSAITGEHLEDCSSEPQNLCVANQHFPVVVTITKAGLSCMDNVKVSKIEERPIHHGGRPIYTYFTSINYLTCDTTSPYFKIINGQIRHIIPENLGNLEIRVRKMRYQTRSGRGHNVLRLNSGWALLRLKKRKASKSRKLSGHSRTVYTRQVVRLTEINLRAIQRRLSGEAFSKKSILIKKIAKRRISNAVKGYFLNIKNAPKPSSEVLVRVTTNDKRV